MKKRKAGSGPNAGTEFWGCTGYSSRFMNLPPDVRREIINRRRWGC